MGRPRTWTDDDLRSAVDGAGSMADVVARLRLSRGGAAYVTVRSRMEQLGLRLSPAASTGEDEPERASTRGWTESQVERAVAGANSLNDVFRRLGLTVGGSQWLVLRSLIQARGWSTAHWSHPLPSGDVSNTSRDFRQALSEADLDSLLRACPSRAAVIRALGFPACSSTYRVLRQMLGQRELAPEFDLPHAAMRRAGRARYRTPLESILVQGATYSNMAVLKTRLVAEGLLAPLCALCGIDSWHGKPLALHLDHVNGVRDDHRLENLRLLCPNCHSQTGTFAGRNRGRYTARGRTGRDRSLR